MVFRREGGILLSSFGAGEVSEDFTRIPSIGQLNPYHQLGTSNKNRSNSVQFSTVSNGRDDLI